MASNPRGRSHEGPYRRRWRRRSFSSDDEEEEEDGAGRDQLEASASAAERRRSGDRVRTHAEGVSLADGSNIDAPCAPGTRGRQQLYCCQGRGAIAEKDETIRKLSSKLQAMEETGAKLKTKVKALEELRGLAVAWQEEMEALRQEVEDLRGENEGLAAQVVAKHKALQTKGKQCSAQGGELEEVNMKMREMVLQRQGLELQLATAMQNVNMERRSREAAEKDAEAQRLSVQQLTEDRASLRGGMARMEEEIGGLRRELHRAKAEREEMDKEVKVARDLTVREVALMGEVEALKHDRTRLLQLLLSTQEYAGFRQYWEDTEGGLHYIKAAASSMDDEEPSLKAMPPPPPPPHHNKPRRNACHYQEAGGGGGATAGPPPACWVELGKLVQQQEQESNQSVMDPDLAQELKREVLSWVPTRAVRLMREFWVRHVPVTSSASAAVLNRLLLDLNEVWKVMEDIRVQRLRERYEESLKGLRRQVGQCRSYDSVVAEQLITRLKKEIKALRSRAHGGSRRGAFMNDLMRCHYHPPSGAYERRRRQDILKASSEAIERLSREVSRHEQDEGRDGDGDDGGGAIRMGSSFLAGATWMGKKAVAIVDDMGEEVDDTQKDSIERLADEVKCSAPPLDPYDRDNNKGAATDQISHVLSHHHKVLLDVQSSTQTCRARMRELLLQASTGRLQL